MYPVIMRQLAAGHIREIHAKAEDERRARQARRARRGAPSTRPRLPASGTLSYDDPRPDAGQQPAMHEQPRMPPLPAMASWADGTALRGLPPLRGEVARPPRTIKEKESADSPPLSTYSAAGGLRQDPGRGAESHGGRDVAGRRGQAGKAVSARVNHTGSSGQDPEHENLQTLAT